MLKCSGPEGSLPGSGQCATEREKTGWEGIVGHCLRTPDMVTFCVLIETNHLFCDLNSLLLKIAKG